MALLIHEDTAFMNAMQWQRRKEDIAQYGIDHVLAQDAIRQIERHDREVLNEQTYLAPIKFKLDKKWGWITGDTITGYDWVVWQSMSLSLDCVLNQWGDKNAEFPTAVRNALASI